MLNGLYLQIALAALLPLLVFMLSLVLLPGFIWIARLSAVLMMLNFGTILYAGFIMSEILFLLFFLLFCILFFQSFSLWFCYQQYELSYKKIFLAVLLLGVASLIRPIGPYTLFVSMLLLLCAHNVWKQKIMGSALLFLGWFSVVVMWLLRNYLLFGHFFFSTMPGLHFMFYLASDVSCEAEGASYLHKRDTLLREYHKTIALQEKKLRRSLNDYETCQIAQNIAITNLKPYPWGIFKRSVINFCKTVFGFHSSVLVYKHSKNFIGYDTHTALLQKLKAYLFPKGAPWWLISVVYWEAFLILFFLFGLCVGGLLSFFNKQVLCFYWQTFPFVALFVLLTFGSGVARLRFPVEPFLIIGGLYALWMLRRRK